MNYTFPYITNISDVLPAIAGRDEFVVAEKEGYTVINYNVMMSDTFPDILVATDLRANHDHFEVENLHARLRRECRGIIFDSVTGEILRRPFHKFFNVNERDETQDHAVDLSRSHAILEKLDGSMIAPFIVDGDVIWGTKMGATDVAKPVEEFVRNSNYNQVARELIADGITPIFEWCSRKQRIVLDYKEDQLILTAARNMFTGEYVSYRDLVLLAERFGLPIVRAFEPQIDMKAFLEYVRDLEDLEGFVVRFEDGHMLKLKCHWYIQIHKAKEAILQDRNIVELIIEEHLDDVKSHLPAEDRDRLTQFESEFWKAIRVKYNEILSIAYYTGSAHPGWDRKSFAVDRAPSIEPFARAVIFKNFGMVGQSHGGNKVWKDMLVTIRNNLSKTVKYETIRDAWFPGVKYND